MAKSKKEKSKKAPKKNTIPFKSMEDIKAEARARHERDHADRGEKWPHGN